jgi:hypothetical protein
MTEVARYFKSQENNANQKQQENDKFQKRSHGYRHQNGRSKYGKNNPSKTNNGKDQKSNDDKEKKVSFNSTTKRSRIYDDAPCPMIHPGAGHKWSQCCSNAYNID